MTCDVQQRKADFPLLEEKRRPGQVEDKLNPIEGQRQAASPVVPHQVACISHGCREHTR